MGNKMKKISLSIIIILLILLTVGQVNAQTYSEKIINGGSYSVTLTGNNEDEYPFIIRTGSQLIFCNQHGASLRNGSYTFNKYNGWLSYQDALAYIFSNYGSKWTATDGTQINFGTPAGTKIEDEKSYTNDYRMLQRIVWNIDTIDRETAGRNDFSNEEWQDSVYTLNNVGLNTTATNFIAEAREFINLKNKIEKNNGQYPCTVEQSTSDPVAVNTDENTYIVGKFKVNYLKSVPNGKTLADITAIDVVNTSTNEVIQNVRLQKADDGSLYDSGELPKSGEEFNVIIPYNGQEIENVKLVVHHKYLAYCEADFDTYRLNSGRYAWQNQIVFNGGYQQWIEGTSEVQTQFTPWTFELQKVGKQNQRAIPNVSFEITFYDANGTVKRDTQVYTTNSNGIIQIPGLDFYGNLKIKIKEMDTAGGYELDDTEKWIYFHKDNGPTNKFTNIQYDEEEILEVNGNDGLKLTALIENIQEGFNFEIVKIDSSTENELSGATFTVTLKKVDNRNYKTIYYGTGLKSPSISITEQDIREYLGENNVSYNYEIDGDYIAEITETKVPTYYKPNLKNRKITAEFTVSKRFLPSTYEIEISQNDITMNNGAVSKNVVEPEDNSTSEAASLTLYIKNERYSGGGRRRRWK